MSQGSAGVVEVVDLAAELNVDEWGCALFASAGAGECGVWGHPACALSRCRASARGCPRGGAVLREENVTGLAAGDGADDEEWLGAGLNGHGEYGFRRVVREIFATGEEADEGAADAGDVVADGALQGGEAGFERIEHRRNCDRSGDVEFDFAAHFGYCPQVRRDHDTNRHGMVWTSTDSTGGRLLAMAVQLSPESDDA